MVCYRMTIRTGIVLFLVLSFVVARADRGMYGGTECERRLQELRVTAQQLKEAIIKKDLDMLMTFFPKEGKTVIGVDVELTWKEVETDLKRHGALLYPILFDTGLRRKSANKQTVKCIRDYLLSSGIIHIAVGYHPFLDEMKCEVGYIRYYWEGMSREDQDYMGSFYVNYCRDEGRWKIGTYSSYF